MICQTSREPDHTGRGHGELALMLRGPPQHGFDPAFEQKGFATPVDHPRSEQPRRGRTAASATRNKLRQ
jgi:hypothetical protein